MSSAEQPQVVWHQESVARESREAAQGHRSGVVWFTGLSGSGKSTIANEVDRILHQRGVRTFLLDGDNVRHGLCATPAMLKPDHGDDFASRFGLGFNQQDREENIRRVGCAAELLVSAGLIVLTAFVSPYRVDRDRVRRRIESMGRKGDFFEVYVNTPIEICEQRDPKVCINKLAPERSPTLPALAIPTSHRKPGARTCRRRANAGRTSVLCRGVINSTRMAFVAFRPFLATGIERCSDFDGCAMQVGADQSKKRRIVKISSQLRERL